MQERVKVSICCLTYNHESFIRKAMDSFLAQKGDFDIEILIHDDASMDATQSIIKEYQEKHPEIVKPILRKENVWSTGDRFISAQYNFPRATGRYIAMCEGDDYWIDDHKLQKQIDVLEKHPHIGTCFTNAVYINEIEGTTKSYTNDLKEGIIARKQVFEVGGSLYPSASLFFRNNLFDWSRVLTVNELSGDEVLFFHLALAAEIFYLEEKTCVYRRWSGGTYSSIANDINKLVEYKKKDVAGYEKFNRLTNGEVKGYLNKRIRTNSFYIVKNSRSLKDKIRYSKYLGLKDIGRLILKR